jgi:hypothetical protein
MQMDATSATVQQLLLHSSKAQPSSPVLPRTVPDASLSLFIADETIITWTDPDIGTDVALSFQEAQGCSAIW